jgi:hypothetical protein
MEGEASMVSGKLLALQVSKSWAHQLEWNNGSRIPGDLATQAGAASGNTALSPLLC